MFSKNKLINSVFLFLFVSCLSPCGSIKTICCFVPGINNCIFAHFFAWIFAHHHLHIIIAFEIYVCTDANLFETNFGRQMCSIYSHEKKTFFSSKNITTRTVSPQSTPMESNMANTIKRGYLYDLWHCCGILARAVVIQQCKHIWMFAMCWRLWRL